jgi:hypothetical protein
MDTYKDAVELNDLWSSGKAPWRAFAPAPGFDHALGGSMPDPVAGDRLS